MFMFSLPSPMANSFFFISIQTTAFQNVFFKAAIKNEGLKLPLCVSNMVQYNQQLNYSRPDKRAMSLCQPCKKIAQVH